MKKIYTYILAFILTLAFSLTLTSPTEAFFWGDDEEETEKEEKEKQEKKKKKESTGKKADKIRKDLNSTVDEGTNTIKDATEKPRKKINETAGEISDGISGFFTDKSDDEE